MKDEKTIHGATYSDAVISQTGIGCVEFKVLHQDGTETQEINIYSQLNGQSKDKWGTKVFSGDLSELITYFSRANRAVSVLSQIGEFFRPRE